MSRIRDWAALAGAVAMVGFLTFVPQHHAVADRPERIVARDTSIDWPPRTADLGISAAAIR